MFRRANGSYRYKRNVPKRLRHLIGKDTLYRQLGESYSEAIKALPKVHAEIEGLFEAEETMPANDRALALIRAALGEHVAEQVSSGQVVEYSHEDYALNELAETIAGKLPEEVVRQVYQGELQSPPVTLDTALSEYAAYKAGEGARDKDAALRIKKLRKDLKGCLGQRKLEKGGLADITLTDTGARLSEIVGLEVRDVDPQERWVALRPNGIRDLKTTGHIERYR